jgi:hypothetical protein
MSVKTYGLQEIKKELQHLNAVQLNELCLRMARYKKENKELLAFLLFDGHDLEGFTGQVKVESALMFSQLYGQNYQVTKNLRKILRLLNKYIKFSGSKQVEIVLLLSFCQNYLQYVDKRTSYKPLRQLLIRQMDKIKKSIVKLHEDLQFDYSTEYDKIVNETADNLHWINKTDYQL